MDLNVYLVAKHKMSFIYFYMLFAANTKFCVIMYSVMWSFLCNTFLRVFLINMFKLFVKTVDI